MTVEPVGASPMPSTLDPSVLLCEPKALASGWAVKNLGLWDVLVISICHVFVPVGLFATEWLQQLARGQVGELQASKPQPRVMEPNAISPELDFGGYAAKIELGCAFRV